MGISESWRRRVVSEAVALNVAVAAMDLDGTIVRCKRGGWKEGGEFGISTDLMENCDSPQIICLQGEREGKR
jgi:hypothetical protein